MPHSPLLRGVLASLIVCLLVLNRTPGQQQGQSDELRIGTSGDLTKAFNRSAKEEKVALETLRGFIQSETGFRNDILPQDGYVELARKLADKQLDLGVLQGHEFAWACAKQPQLRPLAVAVNVYIWRYAHVLVRQDNRAQTLADLQGQSLALPQVPQRHLHLFVERQTLALGKRPMAFFSSITEPDNLEDALDDVVDGVVQAAVVDRVGLESYQRRKPGRFRQLRELVRSEAFPPAVVAYREGGLAQRTLDRVRDGLLQAHHKDKGQRLLTLFKVTGFEPVPPNFAQVLEATRKVYPAPPASP